MKNNVWWRNALAQKRGALGVAKKTAFLLWQALKELPLAFSITTLCQPLQGVVAHRVFSRSSRSMRCCCRACRLNGAI